MPVKKIVRYEFSPWAQQPQEVYTMQDMCRKLRIKKSDVLALIHSGYEFGYHITDRSKQGKLEYFWRVDGKDGDSFNEFVKKWRSFSKTKRAAVLAKGRANIKEQEKRDNEWLLTQDFDDS